MSKPLDSIRVIDFGQYLAGPLVALLLADNGADVIRVDPPGGPRWQHATNAMLQRGKRSIVLNLKDEDNRVVARRLVSSADVVVENFRPGVMERLGLGAAATMEANPTLIYCSIPGFPSTDPRAHLAGWESMVSAAAGLYYPPRLTTLGNPPVYNAVPIASSFAAFIASHSIVAALMARQRTGRGERVEVSLFDAAFEAMGNQAQMIDGKPVPVNSVPTDGRPANNRVMGGRHRCGAGDWVDVSPPMRGQSWFLDHFMPQEAKDAGIASLTNTDPDAVAQLRGLVAATFQSQPAAAWESLANTVAGTGLALCQSTQQWLHDRHAQDTQCVIALHDPEFGSTTQAGYPISFSKTPPATRGPRQRLDADRADLLKGLEAQEAEPRVATSLAGASPAVCALQGIRVLDLTQVLAGPTAARVLAEYGADVIKINNPRPDRNPHGSRAHTYVNNGKRTVLLDLQSPEGLAVLRQLIKGVDVFHQNFIVGAADRLGFGEAAVRALQPEIIYSSVNTHAYGGFRSGWRGHEELGQAVTGMEVRLGGDGEPARCGWAPCDYATGHLSAFGIMLALYHRLRTGEGQHVRASLSGSATFLQVPFMIDFEGQVWDEPHGLQAPGWGPLDRLYQASDRWLCVTAAADDLPRLATVSGLEGIAGVPEQRRGDELAVRFSKESATTWVARLTQVGISAQVVMTVYELMEDEAVQERGLSVERHHPGVGTVRNVGSPPRFWSTPVSLTPAPAVGWHTRDVLVEVGITQFEELVAKAVASGARKDLSLG